MEEGGAAAMAEAKEAGSGAAEREEWARAADAAEEARAADTAEETRVATAEARAGGAATAAAERCRRRLGRKFGHSRHTLRRHLR